MTNTTDLSAEELTLRGYRRTSRKYHHVSRIDRPDWIMHMAKDMFRAPADFYVPGSKLPATNWADHYRRVYSKDSLVVPDEAVFLQIPPSDDCEAASRVFVELP